MIETYKNIYLVDLIRYLIFAGGAFLIFWIIGKPWLKQFFIQFEFPKRKKLWEEFAYSMSTVVIFSIIGFSVYSAKLAGYTLMYDEVADYGDWWFYSSFLISVVLHDLYFYWTHRFMHHKSIYKHVHKVHHKFTNPSPWAAYAFHPFEAVIEAGILPLLIFTMPLHQTITMAFLIYMILRNVLAHLGFELFPKGFAANKWWNWHTTATHHNMHHKYFDCNYGFYFTWWDNLLNTTHNNYGTEFDQAASGHEKKIIVKPIVAKTAVMIIMLISSSLSLNGQSISGRWTTYNESTGDALAVIKIDSSEQGIDGKIIKIVVNAHQTLDPICTKCIGENKDKKVIGMQMLWGFKKSATEWQGGMILDPHNGVEYKSKIWLESNKLLKVRGYGGPFSFFWRTQDWLRAEQSSDSTSVIGLWKSIDDRTGSPRALISPRKADSFIR